MDVLGVDNVLVAVGDLDEARRFYGELLGLPLKFAFEEIRLVGFRIGGEEPALLARESRIAESGPRETPRLWIEVSNARAVAVELRRKGVALIEEPRELFTGWVVEVADPWGNVLGFTDYTKMPERARRPR